MQTKIYSDLNGFYELAREWDDLLARTEKPLLFMRYVYQSVWWRHLGNDQLRLIAIRTDEGKLVGLAPLYLKTDGAGQRQLTFVGCVDVSDYLDLLVDKDYVAAVHEALLDCLADKELAWDKLYLCSLPHDSLTHSRLAEAARRRGWRLEIKQQDICPVITLADDWESYLAGVNKKQRHEIRRKIRKIETEAETRWYVVSSEAEIEKAMADFIRLHQKSTQDKEEFWSEALVAFFRALALELARCGWLKLYFIEVNGAQAAAMLCFDYYDEFLLYNSGYDPEQFAHLSPGNVLTAYTIQHAIELGRKRYDFLRGDEVYKFRFGAEPEPVYDLEIYR
jgi:CelD/BcsL family acetyltransferase involved in cellulose biosynthesis